VGSIDEQTVLQLREIGRPLVLIDNNLPHLGLDRVLIENVGSSYRTVMWLVGLGHRQIACLSGPQDHPSFRDRLLGYRMAIADLGLRSIELRCEGPLLVRGAGKAITERLATHDGPGFSALIACNDEAAIGAMNALQDHGLQVPGDVSVVGFDDIDMARVVRPALTTCHVQRELLGMLGVRRLLERAGDPEAPPLSLVVDTHLTEGASTAPL
jgi:DNA-binding LacI/PurR family transcriptional regulator